MPASAPLATALAAAIPGDAALTLLQAVSFDLPRAERLVDLAVLAIAVIAPAGAAILLWGAVRARHAGVAGERDDDRARA